MKLNELFDAQRAVLTPQQAKSLRDVKLDRADDWAEGTEEALYFIFSELGEMPYGTAKARTGDPSVWIANRIDSMSLGQLERFIGTHTQPISQEDEETTEHRFTKTELLTAFKPFLDRLALDHGNDRDAMIRYHIDKLVGKTYPEILRTMPRGPKGRWGELMSDVRDDLRTFAKR